ncbi:MAG TPA: hypothetical protein V6C97_01300 [Oculatellaceae cyanobacterium]
MSLCVSLCCVCRCVYVCLCVYVCVRMGTRVRMFQFQKFISIAPDLYQHFSTLLHNRTANMLKSIDFFNSNIFEVRAAAVCLSALCV